MASPVTSPHPMSVMRYLKTAFRAFQAGGNGVSFGLVTPTSQPAANPLVVTGALQVPDGFPIPRQISVALVQGGTTKGTQVGQVNQSTGAWTVTFPANTGVAGATTLTGTTAPPDATGTATSNSFTLT